jgi:hypothetical protein
MPCACHIAVVCTPFSGLKYSQPAEQALVMHCAMQQNSCIQNVCKYMSPGVQTNCTTRATTCLLRSPTHQTLSHAPWPHTILIYRREGRFTVQPRTKRRSLQPPLPHIAETTASRAKNPKSITSKTARKIVKPHSLSAVAPRMQMARHTLNNMHGTPYTHNMHGTPHTHNMRGTPYTQHARIRKYTQPLKWKSIPALPAPAIWYLDAPEISAKPEHIPCLSTWLRFCYPPEHNFASNKQVETTSEKAR